MPQRTDQRPSPAAAADQTARWMGRLNDRPADPDGHRADHRPAAGVPVARLWACLSACIVLVSGCDRAQNLRDWNRYPSQIERLAAGHAAIDPLAESQQRGRAVYTHYCLICHGAQGQGDGFNSAMLDPPPRDFTDKGFWAQTDDQKLVAVIQKGGPALGKSNLMPAWGHTLSEQQIRDLIAFLHTLPEAASHQVSEPPGSEGELTY